MRAAPQSEVVMRSSRPFAFGIRDLALILAAVAGFHALFVEFPAWLARPEPSSGLLPLTAPDCAPLLREGGFAAHGGSEGPQMTPEVPASPVRR
jgi:hypothetical protein